MGKKCALFSAVLFFFFAGYNENKQGLAGTWTGKGIVAYQDSVRQEWDVTVTFSEDMKVTISYNSAERKYTLTGDYRADLSKHPALIDFLNFGIPEDTLYCCLAIAEFPDINKMNLCGVIGQCGEISRPAGFNRTPSDHHQLYHELTKNE